MTRAFLASFLQGLIYAAGLAVIVGSIIGSRRERRRKSGHAVAPSGSPALDGASGLPATRRTPRPTHGRTANRLPPLLPPHPD